MRLLDELGELPPLPEARAEARAAAAAFAPGATRVFVGHEATERRAKGSLAGSARRLHCATHGLVSERRPAESALLLSASGEAEDGLLQVREILALELHAETVVLSACRTGLGRRVDGEGFLGLTQAFFFAGARSAVVSLWAVSDRGTADLMGRFYEGLADGRSESDALRSAQIALIESDDLAAPYYWAPFVVAGAAPAYFPVNFASRRSTNERTPSAKSSLLAMR